MTRGEFDPDLNDGAENGREGWTDAGNMSPENGVIPPETLEAGVEGDKDVEEGVDEPYPGELPRQKPTDPDEWHH